MDIVRIAQLADDSTSMISHRSFEGVEIRGPAVLAPLGGVSFDDCTFEGAFGKAFESVMIVVSEGSAKVGIIGLEQVAFVRCQFRNVALIGTDELAVKLGRELLKGDE